MPWPKYADYWYLLTVPNTVIDCPYSVPLIRMCIGEAGADGERDEYCEWGEQGAGQQARQQRKGPLGQGRLL